MLPLNGVTTGIGNANFSETAFNFHVTPQIMIAGVIFAVVLGAVGGLFPARMASRKGDPHGASGSLKGKFDADTFCIWKPNSRICRIDRSKRRSRGASKWATRWIVAGVLLFLLLGAWRFALDKLNAAPVVELQRVRAISAASAPEGVVLNATGYIVAAHKIEVAAKVIGKVNWIGVDKGDRVKEGQVMVRLEDDEYQAQLMQAKGQLANLQAKLDEALHGSRPEEIAQAQANLESAKADLDNAQGHARPHQRTDHAKDVVPKQIARRCAGALRRRRCTR